MSIRYGHCDCCGKPVEELYEVRSELRGFEHASMWCRDCKNGDALERKYMALAQKEIDAKKKAGLEITPEWLDTLELKYMAMAFDCAVEELGQVKHRLETDEAYAAFIAARAQ